jgi:hypothetical protein
MKRHWHRLVLIAATALLSILLVVLGVVVWLYHSGRLASLAQPLLQRLTSQEVTFEAVEFPSWNTVALTNVRLRQRISDWHLEVAMPRLEVSSSLVGLLRQQLGHVHLQQPRLELVHSTTTLSTPPLDAPLDSQPVAILPFKRLTMQQGTLQVRWQNQAVALHQLEAMLQPQGSRALHVAVSGSLDGSVATFRMTADTVLGEAQPAGRLQLSATAVPLPLLAEWRSQTLPPAWKITEGTLHLETELAVQHATLHGRVTSTVEQVTAQTQGLTIHGAALSTVATLEAPYARWSLRRLELSGQVRDGAFSTPDSTYASERLNAALQATAAFDEAAGQHTLHGTLSLQPFALLIGSVFPAIEENGITSVLTFSGAYSPHAERLQVSLAGEFGDLGTLTLQGAIHQPLGMPQYDLQIEAQDVQAARVWHTFMHDTARFPTLAQASVQGQLDAALRLHGSPTNVRLQGTLHVTDGHFQTASAALHGVSLWLPLQGQYPLPQTTPDTAALPPEAYGRLSMDALRLGDVDLGRLSTTLVLQSDSVVLQPAVQLFPLDGQVVLEHLSAWHLLRPQRRLTAQVRLRDLDLQRLPRSTTKLPLAGVLSGDVLHLDVHGDQLDTHGALTLQVAGGVVRIFDIHGSNLFSTLPTLHGSLTTEKPLSLSRLTDLYPIGTMGGTVHFTVTDLTLTAGEPAAFTLDFAVQESGGETRQITLRALNNLLFTAGSVKVASGLLGDTYRLPYRRFGAQATLRHDTLRLRGKYHDDDGTEYFMQAPALGGGVAIVNRVPDNGIPFRDFLQRLRATVLEKPDVQVR